MKTLFHHGLGMNKLNDKIKQLATEGHQFGRHQPVKKWAVVGFQQDLSIPNRPGYLLTLEEIKE